MAGFPVLSPGEGFATFAGVNRPIDVPAPAVGAEWSLALPGGSWWRLLMGRARFVTGAAVANRLAGLQVLDPDAQRWAGATAVAIAATLTTVIGYTSAAAVQGAGVAGAAISVTVPDIYLPPGFVLRSFTPLLDAGDQYDQVRLWMQEVDLGPYGNVLGRPDEYLPALAGEGG